MLVKKIMCLAEGIGILLIILLVISVMLPKRPQGNLEEADVFVILGFGLKAIGGHDAPGCSNQALATWAVENNPDHKPMIVQWGVYLALQGMADQHPDLLPLDDWVISLPHSPQVNVDTRGAVLQSWILMEQAGYTTPVVVSHPLQLRRAGWLFEQLPIEQVIIPDIEGIPFDRKSVHPQTRSIVRYIPFEVLARLIGFSLGWY